jgi:regulation of enolase protein 1 (concanavalin A-like superfamily)
MTERDIFLAVLDLPDPAARAAYLDAACAGDAARRARVEALLRSHEAAGSFLAAPAVAAPEPDRAATRTLGPDAGAGSTPTGGGTPGPEDEALGFLAPPQRPDSLGRIGHYEVLEVLGRGGFGIVFRAFDEVLQRVVAVKVLAPQMAATSPARKRFLREARSSAQVRHENVVQVYAVEEQPLPYLVMEFIPGETLQQRLDRTGPLDVPEVLRIGRQVAEGLAAAHAQGLIHRDVKPANVLIEGGPQQRVKLTDFGLARAADDASLSQSGVVAGTPMYMAPEQAKGEALDHRADLFSLGSVLYAMLTGHPPFRATTTLAVLKRVAEDDPRPIREVIPEVPAWLCRIVERLHAKNPAHRFQTAREVADLLADCEAQWKARGGLKDFSRIPRRKPRGRRRFWQWLLLAAAAVLVLLALCVAAGAVLYFLAGQRPPVAARRTTVDWGEVVDPLGDCGFTQAGDRLTVTVPGDPSHNLNPTAGFNFDAPRILRDIEGDFEAHVTVLPYPLPQSAASTSPSVPYVGAGLVVWQDETHFLRLFRSWMPTANTFIHPEWYGEGAAPAEKTPSVPDLPTHLRVRRAGGSLQLAVSLDGKAWTDVTTTNLRLTDRVRVGVAVVNSVNQEFTARFEGFTVTNLAQPEAGGWTQLFDGQGFGGKAGWKVIGSQPGNWFVSEGQMIGTGGPRPIYAFDRPYGDFHLRVEANVNVNADAGLVFRLKEPKPSDQGDVFDGYAVVIKAGGAPGTGTVLIGRKQAPWAGPPASLTPGDWFTLEVIARQNHLVVKVDGRTTADLRDPDKTFTAGYFGLRLFTPNTVLRVRKFDVKELPPAPAAAPPAADNAVQPLRDLVAAKERILAATRERVAAGKASAMEQVLAQNDLIEARVRLARAEQNGAAVVTLLQDLVAQREEERRLTAIMVENGIVPADDLHQADARVAEAKTRLAEARSEAPASAAPSGKPGGAGPKDREN